MGRTKQFLGSYKNRGKYGEKLLQELEVHGISKKYIIFGDESIFIYQQTDTPTPKRTKNRIHVAFIEEVNLISVPASQR